MGNHELATALWSLLQALCYIMLWCFIWASRQVQSNTVFPNSFSYGVFANIGSGAVPGGRFREVLGRFRITVPGEVPNDRLQEGCGAGSEPRSEPRVPGRFRGRFRTTGSGKVPGRVLNDRFRAGSEPRSEPRVPGRFRGRFRFTSSGKVPGQVPNHGFQEGSGAGSERQGSGAGSDSRVPGGFRGSFRFTGSGGRIGKRRARRFSLPALLPKRCWGWHLGLFVWTLPFYFWQPCIAYIFVQSSILWWLWSGQQASMGTFEVLRPFWVSFPASISGHSSDSAATWMMAPCGSFILEVNSSSTEFVGQAGRNIWFTLSW